MNLISSCLLLGLASFLIVLLHMALVQAAFVVGTLARE